MNLEANREQHYTTSTDDFQSHDQWLANISVYKSTGDGLASPTVITDSQGRLLPGGYREFVPFTTQGGGFGPTQVQHFAKSIDINGDGLGDILVGPKLYVRKSTHADVLTGVVDGLGHDLIVKYRPLTDKAIVPLLDEPFYEKVGSCTYPQYCINRSIWAVSEVDVDPGLSYSLRDQDPATCNLCGRTAGTDYNKFYYAYKDARSSLTGDGWLGFGTKVVVDVERSMTTTTTYDNVSNDSGHYWKRFKPATEVVSTDLPIHDAAQNAQEIMRSKVTTSYTYLRIQPIADEPHIFSVVPQSTTEMDDQLTFRHAHAISNTIRKVITTVDYDPQVVGNNLYQFGNETHRKTTYSDGEVYETTTTYYPPDLDEWLVNLVNRVTTTSTPADGGSQATRTVSHDYDRGLLHSQTIEPDGDESMYRYTLFDRNTFGLIRSVQESDRAGNTRETVSFYDDDAVNPVAIRNALGQVTTIIRHPGYGLPVCIVDPNGAATVTHYDGFGRTTFVLGPDGRSVSTAYQESSWAIGSYGVTQTGSDGQTTGTVYDRLDRPVREYDLNPDGRMGYSDRTYNSVGNLRSRSMPAFIGTSPAGVARIDYDNLGRVIREWNQPSVSENPPPIESVTLHYYDGLQEYTLDPIMDSFDNGTTRPRHRIVRNPRGQPTQTIDYKSDNDADRVTTFIGYGVFGQTSSIETISSSSIIDNPPRSFHYDSVGRNDSEFDADTMTTEFHYNPWGHLTNVKDQKGQDTGFLYDPLGRVTSETSPLGESTFTWDLAVNGIGRLANTVSAPGIGGTSVSYQYDRAGHQTVEGWNIDSATFRIDRTFENGKLRTVSYPVIPGRTDRLAVEYRYNSTSGTLDSIGPPGTDQTYWHVASRDAALRILSEQYGNNLVARTLAYHPMFGKLESAYAKQGADVIQDLSLVYDDDQNIVRRTDAAVGTQEGFSHDVLKRLRYWSSENGQFNVEYQYDDLGNMRQRQTTRAGVPDPAQVFSYHARSPRMISSGPWGSYDYDDNGDQTTAPGRRVQFTPFHLPLTVSANGRSTEFSYDAHHGRSSKRSGSNSTTYVGQVYQRRADSTGVHHVNYIVSDRGTVAEIVIDEGSPAAAGTSHYLLDDNLGSPVVIVADNGSVSRPRYEPFGQRLSDGDNPNPGSSGDPVVQLGFTGQEHDDELGLIDMKGRIYDPRISRFLTPDPVMRLSPSTQAYHRYSYVQNSPLSKRDPSGFEWEDAGVGDASSGISGTAVAVPQTPQPANPPSAGKPNGVALDPPSSADQSAGSSTPAPSDGHSAGPGIDNDTATDLGINAGKTMSHDAAVRAEYVEKTGRLSPTDSAGRTALKAEARAASSPIAAAAADRMRPMAKESARNGGNASKTNPVVNETMAGVGVAGKAIVAASVALSVNRIVNAPAGTGGHVAAKEVVGAAGAIAGSGSGAVIGALIGAFAGPEGAMVGGAIGAIGGSVAGTWAGERALDGIPQM
ncbi:MAG TPA: RHS repeat-associated core domain-containing protein [Gemmatimonadaceae bacterium]|nr:RHS repeat-associated core domain-containing protein [Gemmatimonadaceae bacterium]